MSRADQSLVLFCRPGFEKDCAAEISTRAATLGRSVWCKTSDAMGLVFVNAADGDSLEPVMRRLAFRSLVFVRDWFLGQQLGGLSSGNRVDPLLDALGPGQVSGLRLSHPDTTAGRSLSTLSRQLRGRLEGGLRDRGYWQENSADCAQIMLLEDGEAWVGRACTDNASPWPMGIPRLKLGGAPSRSASKLEEAFIWFLGGRLEELLRPGQTAVDLGAAPGGWSWQFVRRSIRVSAIDHGGLRDDLMESGLVDHLREDAFRYIPPRPVDWMVCDVVDKPARVNARMQHWLASGWCRQAIFNLKLPMNKRFAEVEHLLGQLYALPGWRIEAKQLYHDREEITVCALANNQEA